MENGDLVHVEGISIHALREESDILKSCHTHQLDISIHALREESDLKLTAQYAISMYFNPRSP